MYCIGVKAAPKTGGSTLGGTETPTGGERVEELIGWVPLVGHDVFGLLDYASSIIIAVLLSIQLCTLFLSVANLFGDLRKPRD